MKHRLLKLGALLLTLLVLLGDLGALLPRAWAGAPEAAQEILIAKKKKKNTATPKKTQTPAPATATPKPTSNKRGGRTPEPTLMPTSDPNNLPTVSPVPEGPIIEPQTIADYIFANGCLPDNFITKKEAQALGWDSSYNYVSDVAPGMSIGGDRFGNYEGLLPTKKGRQYYEADCFYTGGKRNAYRIIFSNDGLVFYTADHYQTFTELHPTQVRD